MEAYKKMSTDKDVAFSSKEYLKTMVKAIWNTEPSALIFVAEVDGQLAGYISAVVNYSAFETPSRILVCDITYVRPKYRKGGVAKALWEAMKAFIDNSNFERIRLNLFPDMEKYNEEVLEVAPFKKETVVYVWDRSLNKEEVNSHG
jgi:GNAT superfamily N-acetyltransferase